LGFGEIVNSIENWFENLRGGVFLWGGKIGDFGKNFCVLLESSLFEDESGDLLG